MKTCKKCGNPTDTLYSEAWCVDCYAIIWDRGFETTTEWGEHLYKTSGPSPDARYFDNPKEAVSIIRDLLLAEDWPVLAQYYDLNGTDIRRSELESGEFFIRTERPEVAHPGGFWKYKHPFPPQFEYLSSEEMPEHRVRVTVGIEIEQGDGRIQQGRRDFFLVIAKSGLQILPVMD